MRKIAIVNHKGGVGKTTSTLNIGAALVLKGKKVLLIDLDPQGSLSSSVGLDNQEVTVYELLKETAKAEDAIKHTPGGYDVICSDLSLSGAEIELASVAGKEQILREAIEPVENQYDYIIVDCPPSLTVLTMNAMDLCNEIYIPMLPEPLSIKGIAPLSQMIAKMKKRINPGLKITGIFFTKVTRNNLSREVQEFIVENFGPVVFETRIKQNVDLAASPSHAKDVFQYDPKCTGANNYSDLCDEILKQEIK